MRKTTNPARLLAMSLIALLLQACGANPSSSPNANSLAPASAPVIGLPPLDPQQREFISSFADVVRSEGNTDYLNDPALYRVTAEFGKSAIPLSALPIRSPTAEASKKPWSSWWFPKIDDTLFRDGATKYSAPLTKYDLYASKKHGRTSSAADFEARSYNPNSLRWEGLCDAWALASLLSPEPKHPVTLAVTSGLFDRTSLTFNISDLKALLLKTYEGVDDSGLAYYGQKFMGNERGWIYPDIFPDQVHRFVEVMLFQQKKAFIMDHDPGLEVWNVPVFRANYIIDRVPDNPNAVSVRLWLTTADSTLTNEREFVGTKELIREYDYVLYGKPDAANNLIVDSGVWIKGPSGVDSRHDHPDYLIAIKDPQAIKRASRNPEIDPQVVDEIVGQSF